MDSKPSASERARLAGVKRRQTEKKARAGAKKSSIDGSLYCTLLVALLSGWGVFLYRAIQPPLDLPVISATSPRVSLSDGRNVAFTEIGCTAETAKFSVLVLHDIWGCKSDLLPNITQDELVQLGVRLVSYDRPGYGESDPHPSRSAITEAQDISEIANLVGLGDSFYVIGISWGALPAFASLSLIPHRLKGVALVSPLSDFWSRQLTESESFESWMWLVNSERYTQLISRHFPGFLHLWHSQQIMKRGFWGGERNGSAIPIGNEDKVILQWDSVQLALSESREEALRQGPRQSVYKDLALAFQDWPFKLEELNLYAEDSQFEGEVQVWQGAEDWACPVPAARFVKRILPPIRYTELEGQGHFFYFQKGRSLAILNQLLGLGKASPACSAAGSAAGGSCAAE